MTNDLTLRDQFALPLSTVWPPEPIRCPQHFFDVLMDGPDRMKAEARKGVADWVKNQLRTLAPGGRLIIPDPETGAPVELVWNPAN